TGSCDRRRSGRRSPSLLDGYRATAAKSPYGLSSQEHTPIPSITTTSPAQSWCAKRGESMPSTQQQLFTGVPTGHGIRTPSLVVRGFVGVSQSTSRGHFREQREEL